jgi:hypothetical protein
MKLNRKQRRALVRQFKHEISVLLQHSERGQQQRQARDEREMRKRVGVIANAQWFREHPEYGNEVRLVDRGGSQKTHRERRQQRTDPAESHIGD